MIVFHVFTSALLCGCYVLCMKKKKWWNIWCFEALAKREMIGDQTSSNIV